MRRKTANYDLMNKVFKTIVKLLSKNALKPIY